MIPDSILKKFQVTAQPTLVVNGVACRRLAVEFEGKEIAESVITLEPSRAGFRHAFGQMGMTALHREIFAHLRPALIALAEETEAAQ